MTALALSGDRVRALLAVMAGAVIGMLPTAAQAQGAQQQTPLLATPGQHGVTDSGAATYSIPLRLPPGAAGMEPRLSLQYSSHSGNGSLGLGWSIGGLSAITRCPRTMASDNARGTVLYDSNDRFCLDGQRLIAIAGGYGAANTEYRLERDPFTRVIGRHSAQTNASYFEVSRRNGELSLYGASNDSRIEAQGKSIPTVWALYRQIDVNQNYLEWTYVEDNANGAWYPARVDYTGKLPGGASPTATFATHARVEFVLEARPAADQVTKYHAGSGQRQTQRIKHIKTYTNQNYTSVILDYRLSYDASPSNGASRVTQIQECTGAGVCLPGTAVTWGAAGAPADFILQTPLNGATSSPGPSWGWSWEGLPPFSWADVNGDGRKDFTSLGGTSAIGSFSVGTGVTPVATLPAAASHPIQLLHGDFNGDGRADIAVSNVTGGSDGGGGIDLIGKMEIHLSTGSGFLKSWEMINATFSSQVIYPCTTDDQCPQALNNETIMYRPSDFNGDGRTDMLYVGKSDIQLWLSTGSTFQKVWSMPHPLNDYVTGHPGGSVYPTPSPVWVGDFDGDGLQDILLLTQDGYFKVYRSTGTGFVASAISNFSIYTVHVHYDDADTIFSYVSNVQLSSLRTAELNGDGKSDLIAIDSGNGQGAATISGAWLSTGAGFVGFAAPSTIYASSQEVTNVLAGDVNGDGKTDFAVRDTGGYVRVWLSTGTTLQARGQTYTGQHNATSSPQVIWGQLNTYFLEDADGDGRDELISRDWWGALTVMRVNNVPVDVDRIAQIDNGLGGQYRFEYATLSQEGGAGLYDKGTLPAYPKQAVQAPYAVVKRSIVAGAGTDSVTNYSYSGLQFELGTGRGLLGFATVTRSQPQAGRMTVTSFYQDYPLTGLTQSVVTTAANSSGSYVQVKRIDNTQHCRAVVTGSPASSHGNCSLAPGRLYYSYLQQSIEQGWDLNGAVLPTVSTSNVHDCAAAATCWGNLSSSTVSTTDGFSKTSSFTYRNDLNRWHFGLPTNTTVQSNAPAWSGLGSAPPIQ